MEKNTVAYLIVSFNIYIFSDSSASPRLFASSPSVGLRFAWLWLWGNGLLPWISCGVMDELSTLSTPRCVAVATTVGTVDLGPSGWNQNLHFYCLPLCIQWAMRFFSFVSVLFLPACEPLHLFALRQGQSEKNRVLSRTWYQRITGLMAIAGLWPHKFRLFIAGKRIIKTAKEFFPACQLWNNNWDWMPNVFAAICWWQFSSINCNLFICRETPIENKSKASFLLHRFKDHPV